MNDDALARLERIMQAGFNTLADLQRETNARLDETNARLGRLEGRFENFLKTAGGETRQLRKDLGSLARRVGRLERKAG